MHKLKILNVDDDADIRDLIAAALEDDYELVQAKTAAECLAMAQTEIPDLFILDCNLPDFDGIEITRRLRKNPLFINTPVLMLTGKGEIDDKVTGLEAGVDDYVVKPFAPQELIARLKMLIRRAKVNLDANPLTRLPGNVTITGILDEKLKTNEKFAVLYCDLDNFKAYNDYYGFDRGDKIIKETARILLTSAREQGTEKDFIGHIGGDDFVVVTIPEKAQAVAEKIITDFDALAPNFFDEKDRVLGFFETKDRDNQIHKFGVTTISIAIITNTEREFNHIAEIAAVGAELKKVAKQKQESNYVFDRRNIVNP